MPNTFSLTSTASPHPLAPFARHAAIRRQPPETGIEARFAQALEAIRTCAGIVWWDGSAVGLRLHGLIGLFEADETVSSGSDREDKR